MSTPSTRSIKVYAIVESVLEANCTQAELEQYLRSGRFSGNTTVTYNQGGIRTVVTKEQIPLTMKQLDSILQRA